MYSISSKNLVPYNITLWIYCLIPENYKLIIFKHHIFLNFNITLSLYSFNQYFNSDTNLHKAQKESYSMGMDSKDKKEAIDAFLSKRKPNWKGKYKLIFLLIKE